MQRSTLIDIQHSNSTPVLNWTEFTSTETMETDSPSRISNMTLDGNNTANRNSFSNFMSNVLIIDFRHWYPLGIETELYGFIMPVLAILVSIINSLMIIAFMKRNLFTSTHIILIAIGLSDMITCLPPSFFWFYMYGWLQHKYFMPYDWCRLWRDFVEVLPSMMHTNSIWLTVCLAIQRIIIITNPLKAKLWCTRKMTAVGIVSSLLISLSIYFTGFFDFWYVAIPMPEQANSNNTMFACGVTVPSFIGVTITDLLYYTGVKQWIRIAFAYTLPLFILMTAEITLIYKLRKFNKTRELMNVNSAVLRRTDRRLTRITIWCVGVFIIGDIPGTVGMAIDCIRLTFNITVLPDRIIRYWAVIINVLLFVTASINFIVYSCMSKDFMEFFLDLYFPVCCRKRKTMYNSSTGNTGNQNATSGTRVQYHHSACNSNSVHNSTQCKSFNVEQNSSSINSKRQSMHDSACQTENIINEIAAENNESQNHDNLLYETLSTANVNSTAFRRHFDSERIDHTQERNTSCNVNIESYKSSAVTSRNKEGIQSNGFVLSHDNKAYGAADETGDTDCLRNSVEYVQSETSTAYTRKDNSGSIYNTKM